MLRATPGKRVPVTDSACGLLVKMACEPGTGWSRGCLTEGVWAPRGRFKAREPLTTGKGEHSRTVCLPTPLTPSANRP
jgi:hypothetical protein